MAHVHCLGESCPEAKAIIHLGCTSQDVVCNADGQTYPRVIDTFILADLASIAAVLHKIATDIRLLSNRKEIDEPFGSKQIGSSAMPYKRNPMRCERICGLTRFVMNLVGNAYDTAATQWLERTLDDSSNRRLSLPEAFLALDGALDLMHNVASGLIVHEKMVEKNLMLELPFLATENILMEAVKAGGDRQDLHERIRVHAQEAGHRVKHLGLDNNLIDLLKADPAFASRARPADRDDLLDPMKYVGRSVEQTERFVAEVVEPLRERYKDHRSFVGRRLVPEDLALLQGPAVRAHDVRRVVGPDDALASGEPRRARREPAVPEVVLGRIDILHVDPLGLERRSELDRRPAPVPRVQTVPTPHRHRLQPTAAVHVARRVRDEPVDQPVPAVLGQVHDARPRIDAHRLVVEPPHRLDRPRRRQRRLGNRRHLKHVPMILQAAVLTRPDHRLLTGQPGAPGRRAARAVAKRPAERQELRELLLPLRVVHDVRRAARRRNAVILARVVQIAPPHRAHRSPIVAERAAFDVTRRQLVVAHNHRRPVGPLERRHPVGEPGHAQPVVHHLADPRDDLVGKPRGQIEQPVGIGHQRTEPNASGGRRLEPATHHQPVHPGKAQRRRTSGEKKVTSIDRHRSPSVR
jgi:hypothetical protein